MIRFLLRFIGFWMFAGGFVLSVLDGVRTLAASALVYQRIGETWAMLSRPSLEAAKTTVRSALPSYVWDIVIQTLLLAPTGLTLALLGAAIWSLGIRRTASQIGYAL